MAGLIVNSFLLVVVVALGAFFYMRASRGARQKWLVKLDLPGRWLSEADGQVEELRLQGGLEKGEFVRIRDSQEERGVWKLSGHYLHLNQGEERYDLHLFKPGQIGLEDDAGRRRVYEKVTDNVVPLRQRK